MLTAEPGDCDGGDDRVRQAGRDQSRAGDVRQELQAPPGNATVSLVRACEGKTSCAYRVDVIALGDQAVVGAVDTGSRAIDAITG